MYLAMFFWKFKALDDSIGLHCNEGPLKSNAQLELGKGGLIGRIACCAITAIAIVFVIWLGPLYV